MKIYYQFNNNVGNTVQIIKEKTKNKLKQNQAKNPK